METRAAVAHEAGKPLTIETVSLAGPKSGEVLVEIKATGVCHTDEFTLSGADPEGAVPRHPRTRGRGGRRRRRRGRHQREARRPRHPPLHPPNAASATTA